ncbi:hypothetical protein BDV98DRAFT_558004 [Pterulicium gracile]|uniref:Uncharacterized protein n=1 Tax=Pterulicium gracile TaxID=1884261 RepID=A0A5C3QZU5_9AGAR|nr:hypothetical protein BDV98DRAFT_558004 [Pterula gracilis]
MCSKEKKQISEVQGSSRPTKEARQRAAGSQWMLAYMSVRYLSILLQSVCECRYICYTGFLLSLSKYSTLQWRIILLTYQ